MAQWNWAKSFGRPVEYFPARNSVSIYGDNYGFLWIIGRSSTHGIWVNKKKRNEVCLINLVPMKKLTQLSISIDRLLLSILILSYYHIIFTISRMEKLWKLISVAKYFTNGYRNSLRVHWVTKEVMELPLIVCKIRQRTLTGPLLGDPTRRICMTMGEAKQYGTSVCLFVFCSSLPNYLSCSTNWWNSLYVFAIFVGKA